MFDVKEKIEKITVLGKTFNNEEERRSYFREELRKHLPDLKKMEGFPIGEDEDILNLSDPPFYTACPNPWLNDFIAEWEEEKKELEKQGLRKADFEVTEPYAADVSEGKNNPIYTGHTYHTKVPHPAIMRYILHYTQPGDIIFDGFAGTGMTGVAAQMLKNPTDDLRIKIESESFKLFGEKPRWGKRSVIVSDLSPAASTIASNYIKPFNTERFNTDYRKFLDIVLNDIENYETEHTSNKKGITDFVLWSDVFLCPDCTSEIIFWESAVDHATGKMKNEIQCSTCGALNPKNKLKKNLITIYDELLDISVLQQKSIPVIINYTHNKKRFEKKPDHKDIDKLNKKIFGNYIPLKELPDGYNTVQPKNSHGYTHLHHFYSKRNLYYLSKLVEQTDWTSPISFLITSMIMRSTQLNRLVVNYYFNGGGGANGAHLKGTLYVSSLPTETSVISQLKSKYNSTINALNFPKEADNFLVSVGSASQTTFSENQVDYIFTDPPFGANIMYSELNFIWESWLKVLTNNSLEAIENKVQNKSMMDYQHLMFLCFKEYYRILKPGKWMTVEFSNTSAAVWNGIQTALNNSGFIVANLTAIDKKQGSFKAVTTPTAVKQDLIISCYKPSSEFDQKFNQFKHSDIGIWEFVLEHLDHLPIHLVSGNSTTAIIERSPKILFDRLIAFYVQRSLPVPIDAGKFQQGLRERFIERDGMFFTNEQVQVYDKKKADVPNFIQMSLFVANEQEAIYWLRHILQKDAKTEQDLHPKWMKDVAGNMRKGDTLPEMRTILEENFLKNNTGQWYLPDPENEADLEKLRTKRLLKQFETYKSEALKPKGKIKEVRVEALRAGFKQCYQDKDFKTIMLIGDRIPNNLLMEDEVLLQFYDIASSKV